MNASTRTPSWSRQWRRFVLRHGWRAYALPALLVLTVVALTTTTTTHPAGGAVTAAGARAAASARGDAWPANGQGDAPVGDAAYQPATPVTSQPPILLRTENDPLDCTHNDAAKRVFVSIEQQHAWMCELHTQVYSTAVTTGASTDNDQTPKGTWYVQARQRDRYLVGPGYRDYVQYWVPFNGDFGFHDAHWQTMPYGSPNYVTQGSHGCVHMPLVAMKWFYGWATPGQVEVTIT